jgi:hypothetical protein
MRLGELINTMRMFEDVDPCDVKQGPTGDCWLVSAISAFAEFPGEKAFVSPGYTERCSLFRGD